MTQIYFSPFQVFDIVCDWQPGNFCIIPKFDVAFNLLDVKIFGSGKNVSVLVTVGNQVLATAPLNKPAVVDWRNATIAANTPVKLQFATSATTTGIVTKILLYTRAVDSLSKQIVAQEG